MNRDLIAHDPQILLDRIHSAFPSLTWTNFEFITHSWDYQVVILDNRLVFRFPASSALLPNLRREIALLEHVHIPDDIAMPVYAYITKDYSFAGYPLVQGNELTTELFERLNAADQQAAQTSIARFLRSLHTTQLPTKLPYAKDNRDELLAEDHALLGKLRPLLRGKLSKSEINIARQTLETAARLRVNDIEPVFIHGDFYHKHILWDTAAKRLGVIDFSDCSLGDPALDFAELYEYGAPFVQKIIQLYATGNVKQLMERALQYYRRVGVFLMINALEDNKIPFSQAYEVFSQSHHPKII